MKIHNPSLTLNIIGSQKNMTLHESVRGKTLQNHLIDRFYSLNFHHHIFSKDKRKVSKYLKRPKFLSRLFFSNAYLQTYRDDKSTRENCPGT